MLDLKSSMPSRAIILAVACFISAACFSSEAQETTHTRQDKSSFNLFNPVPEELLREMAPERPDKTDCPFTLDAGHFEVEMDFVNLTYNGPNSERDKTRSRAVEIAPM